MNYAGDIKPSVSLSSMPWTRNGNVNRISEREDAGVWLAVAVTSDIRARPDAVSVSGQPFHHIAATRICSKDFQEWSLR